MGERFYRPLLLQKHFKVYFVSLPSRSKPQITRLPFVLNFHLNYICLREYLALGGSYEFRLSVGEEKDLLFF